MDKSDNAPMRRPQVALWLGVFLAFYLGAIGLGLQFYFPPNDISSFWPASGVYVAALVLSGYRCWPLVVGIAALSVLISLTIAEIRLGLGAWYALSNAAEALLAAYVIRRLLPRPLDFCSMPQVLVFFFAAVVAAATAAILAALASVAESPTNNFAEVVQAWWFANALGIIIVTPVIITWARLSRFGLSTVDRAETFEALALGGGLILTCLAIFGPQPAGVAMPWNYTYFVLPFLIWAALRFDPRGVTSATFLIACVATWYGSRGIGPFSGPPDLELQSLQAFVTLITLSALLLSSVVTEREQGARTLRESQARFQQLANSVSEAAWLCDADRTQFLYASPAFEEIWGRSCEELQRDPRLFEEAVHDEDKACFLDFWTDPDIVEAQYRIVRPDGSVRWVRSRYFPVPDEQGRIYRVAGITEDVTETRAMETAMAELEQDQARLLLETQNEERETLARELHDGVGQMLVGLRLKLASKPNRADDLAEEIDDLTQTIEAVSKVSRLLHPPELERAEIVTVISHNLADLSAKPAIGFESFGTEAPLSAPAKSHLYRIAQEAITNVLKHARAARVRIEMDWTTDSVTLRVEDDGVGFSEQIHHGVGLRSIQTRAAAIGGHAVWKRNHSGGVTLEVSAPLAGIVAPVGMAADHEAPPESSGSIPRAAG
jgi:PAS domain S-box-containing protein